MPENIYKMPELLLPAGSQAQLEAGLRYGGDAFYLGGPALSLRAQSQGFTWERLGHALRMVHAQGKKIYFCLNILAMEKHMPRIQDYLYRLKEYAVDGIIIADPGIVQLAKTILPDVPIHLSTQANTSNSSAIRFWQGQGISRVNLARELDYKSIKAVRQKCSDIALEVFVHGAMCMALSGRCLLSAYLNDRSANLGLCTNPCRFHYKPQAVLLSEEKRPGQLLWEVIEDDEYSKILAADDLCLVKYLKWFVAVGIDALKVEGRTKSASYVAQVADVYKTALTDVLHRKNQYAKYMSALKQIGDRDLSTGFFLGKPRKITRNVMPDKPVVAEVLEKRGEDKWKVQIKSQWKTEKAMQILVPGLQRPTVAYQLEDLYGAPLQVAHPGTHVFLRASHPNLKVGYFLRTTDF